MATEKKQWSPNEKQKGFLNVLKEHGNGKYLSLKQINSLAGVDYATGTINTLSAKEIVKTKEKAVKYTATIVETRVYENGMTLEITKQVEKAETGYKLV